MTEINIKNFQKKLGFKFKDPNHLEIALIHKSFGNENRANLGVHKRDNERFEFLGDAILDMLISEYLMQNYKDYSEGELSKARASLVNDKHLSLISKEIGINSMIILGKGEESTGGREKESILASALESIIASIYLDSGFDAAKKFVFRIFKNHFNNTDSIEKFVDYKTKLQELSQAKMQLAPVYEIVKMTGPDHEKMFEVQVLISNKSIAKGLGKNKKEAEQNAAKVAIQKLQLIKNTKKK